MLCLRKTLYEWVRMNRVMGGRWMKRGNDAPWWYNERASLSVFAGAVWRTGGMAFEEFSELKRKKKRRTPGRIDLWFSVGRKEFWAEAKGGEVRITPRSRPSARMRELMDQARRDAERLAPDGFTRRLAVVFLSPYLRPCKRPEIEHRVRSLLDQVRETKPDALAWVFPHLKRLPKIRNWVSPGIVCVINEVRRRRKVRRIA